MSIYTLLLRPILFALEPEMAQKMAELLLGQELLWKGMARLLDQKDPRLEVALAGMKLPSPVGLAAGFDKDCRFLPSLMRLGFGYVVGGTVTASPRDGNPRPRLLRYVRERALVNAMGFPSRGLEAALRSLRSIGPRPKPLMVSVAGLTIDEFILCHRQIEPLADAVELNISSPNTSGLQAFHEGEALARLLGRINEGRRKPIFVKIPPYQDDEGRERVLGLVRIAREEGVEGITATNTRPVKEPRLKVGSGGLSGRPIFEDTLRIVAEVRREAGRSMAINACGGVFSGGDALKALRAGADTVQLYTALVYEGPAVAKRIGSAIAHYLAERGLPNVAALSRKET